MAVIVVKLIYEKLNARLPHWVLSLVLVSRGNMRCVCVCIYRGLQGVVELDLEEGHQLLGFHGVRHHDGSNDG